MARGHHNAAIHIKVAGRKVNLLRATLANVEYIAAAIQKTFDQGIWNFRAGKPDVMAYNHLFWI